MSHVTINNRIKYQHAVHALLQTITNNNKAMCAVVGTTRYSPQRASYRIIEINTEKLFINKSPYNDSTLQKFYNIIII